MIILVLFLWIVLCFGWKWLLGWMESPLSSLVFEYLRDW